MDGLTCPPGWQSNTLSSAASLQHELYSLFLHFCTVNTYITKNNFFSSEGKTHTCRRVGPLVHKEGDTPIDTGSTHSYTEWSGPHYTERSGPLVYRAVRPTRIQSGQAHSYTERSGPLVRKRFFLVWEVEHLKNFKISEIGIPLKGSFLPRASQLDKNWQIFYTCRQKSNLKLIILWLERYRKKIP